MMNRSTLIATLFATMLGALSPAWAGEPTCGPCGMKIDVKNRVHFRYTLTDGKAVELGSLTCAKNYWSEHKTEKLIFTAVDFVTGKMIPADTAHYLVGSNLKVGTGMDKGSVVVFGDRKMADKAKAANGGRVVGLNEALNHAARAQHAH